jgi:hypothetical protein
MREYELVLDKALITGISPERNTPINSQVLYECLDFRCSKDGLVPFTHKVNPLSSGLDIHYVWPFPQYITGEKFNFLVVRDPITLSDKVYSISDDHVTNLFVFEVDQATFGIGQRFDVADFGEFAFMSNEVCMIYWNIAGAWNASVGSSTIPLMSTVCNLKGQLVGGGIRNSWYDCDTTFYVWSAIGHADFTPNINNEAGYRKDPYGGVVYHTKRLGDYVVGYSSKGIVMLRAINDPAPTLGLIEVGGIGLHNKGAMAGGVRRHLMVGEDHRVRELTSEGIKDLGYDYLIESLTSGDIIVNYDEANNDFYIGDSVKTFLLSPYGMSEIQQHPSGVWRRNQQTYMIPSTSGVEDPRVTSGSIDFGYSGQKTNSVVEISAEGYSDAEASVDYKINGTWRTRSYSPINYQGIATVIASGDAFRFKVKFPTIESTFKLSQIKSRYKMTDLRGIRGVYAPPLRGQSD